MTKENVLDLLWERKGRGTSKELAERLGVSQSYLSDVFAQKRDIGEKILGGLGLMRNPDQFIVKPKRKAAK